MLAHHAVLVEDGRIADIVSENDPRLGAARRHDLQGQMLLPGFIDTQVNGGGGVFFNDDPTPEAIRRIGAAHRKFGTTGFLPTLISDDLGVVERGIAAVDAAIRQGVPGVLGIHLEGPFLSPARKGRARCREIPCPRRTGPDAADISQAREKHLSPWRRK